MAAALGFVLLIHFSILFEQPLLASTAILALCLFALVKSLIKSQRAAPRVAGLALGGMIVGLYIVSLAGERAGAEIVYAMPVLLNGYLCVRFGRTLAPGQEPLITRFCRLERGKVPHQLVLYTKHLTVAWTVLLGAIAIGEAVLAFFADLGTWSWYANVIGPLVMLGFFVFEFPYRMLRYGHLGPHSIARSIKVMMRRETWATE